MNNYISARFFRTVLFSALVAVGLSVTGCDSLGIGSPEWVGDWGDVDENIALSITKDKIETFFAASVQGTTSCEKNTSEVTNVDGNTLTFEDEDGETNTVTLNVKDNGKLEVKGEEFTQTYDPLDQNPTKALGCDSVR